MLVNADLHIHSPFSMAVSGAMLPENLLAACVTKGIDVLGTGDALHPVWQKSWEPYLVNESGVTIIPTGEVEDEDRVHHLILAEELAQFDQIREAFEGKCKSFETSGRPYIHMSGNAIATAVHDAGGMIGPAHAFTPWRAIFAYFDHVGDCYGSEPIDFLELGLSADSSYGAAITDLTELPFLSNSDAHSPLPEKIGREFNCLRIKKHAVKSVLESLKSGAIDMNAGFFPEEGKYNRTACVRCFTQYSLEQAVQNSWRCPADGGLIKKGVFDRARELSAGGTPGKRPPYLHIIPLGQIIQTVERASSPHTKRCQKIYDSFTSTFGNEINVLVNSPVAEIRGVHSGVAVAIDRLRTGRVILHPGGGGKYGTFSLV
ncbi:MAG: endonuclease Q family protein [Methanoregula sp.]|nr:endonuclease Q family protein [Methanoregula sp.]